MIYLPQPQECGCEPQDPGESVAHSTVCNGTLLFMAVLQSFIWGHCAIVDPCRSIRGVKESDPEYDFVVVGGGAAGSIVAARLSEIQKFKVLLIEAGGPEVVSARVPSFYRSFWGNAEVDWRYRTVPADYCLSEKGKGCNWPRGKALGGTAMLNGMMYHRGHPADYDDWVQFGATDWSWNDTMPYFDKTENNKQIGTLVKAEYHGRNGPLPIQQFRYQPEMVSHLLQAARDAGFPVIRDMNDPDTPDGFVVAQTFNDNGQRYTTARAYLKNVDERPNLHVLLKSKVHRVLFDDVRAIGVEYENEHGETYIVKARKEVILCAGALNSPQILMLSGVGPKQHLDDLGIPVVSDLPVGQNLRNHYGMTLYFLMEKVPNTQTLDWVVATEYLLNMRGPMTAPGITQMTGLLYSRYADASRRQPDLQFFFNSLYAECSATGAIGEPVGCPGDAKNITINIVNLLPKSVGFMSLDRTNPRGSPLFHPQYFTHPDDMEALVDGARYVRKMIETDILKEKYGFILDKSYTSACDSDPAWSGGWLSCMARVHTDPQNHQLGTAAIGRVLDQRLRVARVKGVRVVDAASIPLQMTGNPQGAVMMVAERGADMIKEDWGVA